jgi:hypothetical protein
VQLSTPQFILDLTYKLAINGVVRQQHVIFRFGRHGQARATMKSSTGDGAGREPESLIHLGRPAKPVIGGEMEHCGF